MSEQVGSTQIKPLPISLIAYPDRSGESVELTPRSMAACAAEGIDPFELVYKPIEEFVEKGLSPRLVKLRYDFYEAKRKDLMASAVKSREGLLEVPPNSGHIRFLMNPKQSDILKLEKSKQRRAQADEHRWLQNVLKNELRLFKQMKEDHEMLRHEEQAADDNNREESERMRLLSLEQHEQEQRKQREIEAELRADREQAKRDFEKHQEELRALQDKDIKRKQELYEKSVRDAEKRRNDEENKRRQEEENWRLQQLKLEAMQLQDKQRLAILAKQKNEHSQTLRAQMDRLNNRIKQSQQNNMQLELFKREEYLAKIKSDAERDNRLDSKKRSMAERSAMNQLSLQLKRKNIAELNTRKLDEKRNQILSLQNETEKRLAENETKRQRFLAFKRELEALKEKNKFLNVQRQRRRDEHWRQSVAKEVELKDEKMRIVEISRNRGIWAARRKASMDARAARDSVKQEIMKMRIQSNLDPGKVEAMIAQYLAALAVKEEPAMHATQPTQYIKATPN